MARGVAPTRELGEFNGSTVKPKLDVDGGRCDIHVVDDDASCGTNGPRAMEAEICQD